MYATESTNPIADVTADVIDLDPVGLFTQGVVSPRGLGNIGQEILYIGRDGLRSMLASFDSKTTDTTNKSEQIKSELVQVIADKIDDIDQMQLAHYPRRNWVMMKIGGNMYNYNYTPTYQLGQFDKFGTITRFTGLLAEQDAFFVRRDGTMITGDSTGTIYQFDSDNVYQDGTEPIFTKYLSPWHTLQESQSNIDLTIKDGRYVKPVFETGSEVVYTIKATGGYKRESADEVDVTAAGAAIVGKSIVGDKLNNTSITNDKFPLRWRGEQVQVEITTDTSAGPDIISSYTLYGNVFGRR